jgi:glycerol-3-phosphate dehydrogenase
MADFDLAIIGGGINGAGIARDAAGRGLRVLLVEQADLASGTSSASTKLIHGGLRYLEHGAFKLVREALIEREVLWRMAPHIIRPLRFVLPPQPGLRSSLVVRLGLFIYDHLGGRKLLPPTRTLDLTHHPVGDPLKRRFQSAYEYSDCWVDDSRLVVLNALDAAERGASIRTRTKCVRAERGDVWSLVLYSHGRRQTVTARVLVNAAGPWVAEANELILHQKAPPAVRLVKGSHIVVPKMYDHDRAYIFQNADRRVVFAIPFERDFTLIGTTDEDFTGDLGAIAASEKEVRYLCATVNDYFRAMITPADVVWTYAGVRALYDDGSGKPEDVTRDYQLTLDKRYGEAPLLCVYGGKITTYRRLAENALAMLQPFFVMPPAWTAGTPLPGGDFPYDMVDALAAQIHQTWPFLTEAHVLRLTRAYGTRAETMLRAVKDADDLGQWFGADLTETEVRYLMEREWAREPDDVLWRRSKLGLRLVEKERAALARFMAEQQGVRAAE